MELILYKRDGKAWRRLGIIDQSITPRRGDAIHIPGEPQEYTILNPTSHLDGQVWIVPVEDRKP